MKKLIIKLFMWSVSPHYNYQLKRGTITKNTTAIEFIDKTKEEIEEARQEIIHRYNDNNFLYELIDTLFVILNCLLHFFSIKQIAKAIIKNINTQKERANGRVNK